MITFVTLFLQLVTGSHPVEVAVGGAVVEIELRLDGRSIGVLRGEPWSLDCDFGAQLAPHELVAIGYDSAGRQVARADQWINLPRHRSQVELVPDASDDGPPRSVRLVWRSVDGSQPDAVRVSFDGRPLALADPSRVELPPYDPDVLHLLQAELQFGPSTAYGEISLGGSAGEVVGSGLTAFPVMLAEKRKAPSPAEMVDWFRKSGRPLRVVAVERGPADLLMVQDQSARTQGLLLQLRRDALNSTPLGDSAAPRPSGLKYRDRLRVIVPQPMSRETGSPALFPISPDLASLRRGPTSTGVGRRLVAGPRPEGLLAALPYPAGVFDAPQRLADAVAEAGRAAAAGRRARVLVLVTGRQTFDESRFDPATVRAYLRLLQVPLLVWSPEAAKGWDAWGEMEKISSPSRLFRAVRGARSLLDRQLVVWLEGQHLPQGIELSPQAAQTLLTLGDSIPSSSKPTKPENLPRIAAAEPAATPTPAAAEPGALSGPPGPPAEIPDVEPSSIFMEAVDVSVVNVTAVVTDGRGRRVLDLDRGDFEIYEDGRLEEITHFAVPRGPSTEAVRDPEPQAEPLRLLAFVDTSRLRMAHRRSVTEALRDVLQRVSAPVMLVVFDGAVQIRQGFTTDLEQMMAALAEIEAEIGKRPEPTLKESRGLAAELAEVESEFESARRTRDPYALERARSHRDSFLVQVRVHGEVARRQIRATLEAIQRFAASLGPVAGRKVLLYVGDQLVMRPASELYLGIERADLDLTQTELSRLEFEATTLSTEREFQAMTRQANGSGVTFYALTPPSLEHPGAVTTASAGPAGLQVWMRNERSAAVREAVCLISYSTGGLCQVEGSDPQLLLHDALADFASSYSLGYSPGREADGRFHKIEVKVKRPDLKVRHREGYLAKPRQDRLRDRLIATLLYGAEDNALGVTLRFDDVEPLEGKKTQLLPMDVRVPVPRLALLPLSGSDRREARLRLILAVAGAAGRISKVQEYPIRFQVSEEQLTEVPPPLYVHNVRLTIESAVQRVAVGLWDEIGLVGSFLQQALEDGAVDEPAVVPPTEPRP